MNKVIAIVGPTASGKTDIAYHIAGKLNSEIISADSRQIYRKIPIATSVPPKSYLNGINHHFIEILEPEDKFNAGEFGKQGREVIENLFASDKIPVIAGGSGLYIRSLIDGFFETEIKDESVTADLYEKLEKHGKEYLYNELVKVDPEAAKTMSPHFFRRVIRALEVFYSSGLKISDLQKENVKVNFETVQYGLLLERKYLYERINLRVDNMLKAGLVEEVRALKESGYDYQKYYALNTVGVREVFDFLDGKISFDYMVELIKRNSRRYGKRQMTWFRNDNRINWIEIERTTDIEKTADEIIKHFKRT